MPRKPAQPVKPRKYCRTEFHPDAEGYLKDLADDVGVEVGYIIRLCVAKSLPEIEAVLRSGELPKDEFKRPSKPLKTTLRKPKPIPEVSKQPPPPIATFLETGEMPTALPESCALSPSPEPISHRQEPERPAEPAAPLSSPSASDRPDVAPTPIPDPLQLKLQRVGKMRRG